MFFHNGQWGNYYYYYYYYYYFSMSIPQPSPNVGPKVKIPGHFLKFYMAVGEF